MSILRETIGDGTTGAWGAGVIGAVDPTTLPPNASPYGLNSALASPSLGVAFVQKRRGLSCLNTTPITGSPAVIGLYQFRLSGGTSHFLWVSDNGRLDEFDTDHAATIDATAFTSGTHYPAFLTAADLCFMVNGVDAIKYNGTTVSKFGIDRPTVGTLSAAAGAAGTPSGTYELRVAYRNTSTGHTSSASNTAAATVVVVNQRLSWSNIPVSADPQVDFVVLGVRNTATQTQFFEVGTVANGITTATSNFVDANLTTPLPSTTANDPPPAGAKHLAYYQGRVFVITNTGLYYSQVDQPESFDLSRNFDPVNAEDGQRFMAVFSDHEVLLICKENRTYMLIGNDPATWQIHLIDADIGCATFRTMFSLAGSTWWWGLHGLVKWDGGNTIEKVGTRLYGDPAATVNFDQIAVASAVGNAAQSRMLFSLPGLTQTRATFMVPYSTNANAFEATAWDPMDGSCLGSAIDDDGVPQMYLGGYAGQVFQLWTGNNDAITTGTTTGTVTPATSSLATLTDAGAAFDVTGGKLIERRVTLIDPNGFPIATRPRITGNTATVLTFDAAVIDLTPGVPYTYIIGAPNFVWDTPWRTCATPWVKKRFEYLFTLFKDAVFSTAASVDLFFDYSETGPKTRTISTPEVGALWDSGIWDQDVWDGPGNLQKRTRLGRVGFAWRVRVRNAAVNAPFAMLMVGVQAVGQTTKQ